MMYEEENGFGSISGYDARVIADKIVSELNNLYPDAKISPEGRLGRYGRIKDNESCDEIEILFGYNGDGSDDFATELAEAVEKAFDTEASIGGGAMSGEVSFLYEDDEVSVPVTITITNNYDWTRGFARSRKRTSFSDTLREIIINEMVSVSPLGDDYKEGHEDEFFQSDDEKFSHLNGLPVSRWKHSLDIAGGSLNLVRMGAEMNKNGSPRTRPAADGGLVTRWGPITDKQELTRNFTDAIKIIGGPKARWQDFVSIENLLSFLFSDRYGYPEMLNELKTKIDNRLKRSSAGVEGDVESFNQLWNDYMQKNQNTTTLNEHRLNKFAMRINNLTARMNLL